MAEDGCFLCSSQSSCVAVAELTATLSGLSHPYLCAGACTLEGHSEHRAGKCPALPPAMPTATGTPPVSPHRGASSLAAVGASASLISPWVCPAEQELLCAHSQVSTHTRCPEPRGCWLRLPAQPGEAQQCLLPRMFLPTWEPQGVPQENRTVRYLQPDPTLGLWFPPCFLFPHRPQHLGQK